MSDLLLPAKPALIKPDPQWEPQYWTRPLTPYNRGDDIADFAASTMTASKGMKRGLPLELTEWQKFVVRSVLEEKEDGYLRYKRFCIGLPRKNGKSMLGTSIALEHLFYGHEGTQIYATAKDREQAKLVFGEAKKQIAKSKILSDVLKPYRDTIVNKRTGAFFKASSSDAGSFQGTGPSLVICDELHAWTPGQAEEFWAAINEGSGDLNESLIVAISTAGKNLESQWGQLYEHGIKVVEGKEVDKSFGFIWWGADEDDDIFDEEVWRKSNPNIAEGLLSIQDMRDSLTLAQSTGNLNHFKRYKLNQWVRVDGHETYISNFHWENAKRPELSIKEGARIVVGFDGSLNNDSTGFVGIDMETGCMQILASWENDYSDADWTVPRKEVNDKFHEIMAKYDVVKVSCDDAFFQTDVQAWATKYRGKVLRKPQSNVRMIPITEQLKIDIISGDVVHNDDPALTRHFRNAVQDANGKVRKERPGSKNKIDFVVCAIMANEVRNIALRKNVKRKALHLR